MKIFDALLEEIEVKNTHSKEHIHSLEAFIKSISAQLLDEKFNPSIALKNLLDKYLRRAKYPMEVAIVGQFSSGKSTFLNALLSKDVLPTGITPVTSKVNFINYADEYKLKVTFKSGATEFHNIEHLAKFGDQRESIDDVKYLSLYAPVEMLKEISFVDTPGLNSQSSFDTQTTNTILRDVDGIIWLGLIDAVAKKSELDVLEKFLPNYANKSICLLNQKDRITPEQVDMALEYAKQNYKNFFSKTIAISAKQALDSRINQKSNLLLAQKKHLVRELENHILLSDDLDACNYFSTQLDNYKERIQEIENRDYSNHLNDLEDSNIIEVLDFIERVIRPKARESKKFAIKKDLRSLCDILIDEYTIVLNAYTKLANIIESYSETFSKSQENMNKELNSSIQNLKRLIDDTVQNYTHAIYSNLSPKKSYRLEEKKSLLSTTYVKAEYQSYQLKSKEVSCDSTLINNTLSTLKELAESSVNKQFKSLENSATLWQLTTLKLQKKREVASDIEYTNLHQFSAGLYENILNDFSHHSQKFAFEIESKLHKLSLSRRFEKACEKSLLHIRDELERMQESYEKDPQNSVINALDESEIVLIFKEYLEYEYLKREFNAGSSFIDALITRYSAEQTRYISEKQALLEHKTKKIKEKIDAIKALQETI